MSAQDKRVVDAVEDGAGLIVGALREPLVKALGAPVAWVWDDVQAELGGLVAKGVLALIGALVESGHVVITGGPGATVGFEVLPPDLG